jgi:hypothetical protein
MSFVFRAGGADTPEDVLARLVPTLFYGRPAQASPAYRSGTGMGGRIGDRGL